MIFSKHKHPLRCSLYLNEDFYSFATQSGKDAIVLDPAFETILLLRDCENVQLGEALLTCLQKSRAPLYRNAPVLYKYREVAKKHDAWCKKIIQDFGYKTKRNMFSNLRNFSFEVEQNHNPLKSISVKKYGGLDKNYGWNDVRPIKSDLTLGHDLEDIGKFISQLN